MTLLLLVLVAALIGAGACYLVFRQTLNWLINSKPTRNDVAGRIKALLYVQLILFIIVVGASYVAVMNRQLANQASSQSLGYLLWSVPLLILSVCYRFAMKKYLTGQKF